MIYSNSKIFDTYTINIKFIHIISKFYYKYYIIIYSSIDLIYD